MAILPTIIWTIHWRLLTRIFTPHNNKLLGFFNGLFRTITSQSLDLGLLLRTEHKSTSPLHFIEPMFGLVGWASWGNHKDITDLGPLLSRLQKTGPGSVPGCVTITWVCRLLRYSGSKEVGDQSLALISMEIRTKTAEVHRRDLRNIRCI